MADFKKILAKANKNWKVAKKKAKEAEPAFTEIDDGRYMARLVSAKLGVSESGGRNQIAFNWKIEDGEFEGKTKTNYQGIDSEDNLYYLARDLERLGYELPDDLTDLPEILKDIEKSQPVASIAIKTKGDFQNVYIRKVYAGTDEDEEGEVEDEDTDPEEETEEEDADGEEETEEEEASDEEEESDGEDAEEEEESEEEESEEEEESDDEGEEVDITVGMRVLAETAKGREPGEIIEILEKEEKVRIRLDNKKVVRLGIDKIEAEPEEEEIPAEPVKKKVAAKPESKKVSKSAPAPAKKVAAPVKKSVAPASKKTVKKKK